MIIRGRLRVRHRTRDLSPREAAAHGAGRRFARCRQTGEVAHRPRHRRNRVGLLVYAKKYAWKSELDALFYAAHEMDPCREASENPAWLCRQHRVKRFLLRPNAANVVLRLVAARSFRSGK